MKLYDSCIVIKCDDKNLVGSFAFIIEDEADHYLVEVWNFKKFSGAKIMSVNKTEDLRLATQKERDEYVVKFKEYCERHNWGSRE